jgi:hypothetical protein
MCFRRLSRFIVFISAYLPLHSTVVNKNIPTFLIHKKNFNNPKSGSYPVVGKPDVGVGGPMMGAMRSLM